MTEAYSSAMLPAAKTYLSSAGTEDECLHRTTSLLSMSTKLSALIIGYGPRAGRGVLEKLRSEGYAVAVANRHPDLETAKKEGYHAFYLDLSNSDGVDETLDAARKELLGDEGSFNVVIYNGKFSFRSRST